MDTFFPQIFALYENYGKYIKKGDVPVNTLSQAIHANEVENARK